MKTYFSPSQRVTYPENLMDLYLKSGTIPDDLIELTEQEVAQYFDSEPPINQILSTDENGRPIFIDVPLPTAEEQAAIDAAEAKRVADNAINNLTVDVDGLVFKANDKSISRMVAAILDSQTTGDTSTIWKMADGSNQTITIDQLKTAQSMAIRAIGALVVV